MLKITKNKNTLQTVITRKSEHLIVDEVLNDHKILIGKDNTISSSDSSISDIKSFVLNECKGSFPSPLTAGKNIKIEKNEISCVMYDDLPLKTHFEAKIEMNKQSLEILNKDISQNIPKKITQEIKDNNKELLALLDDCISGNQETKSKFETYCERQIAENEVRQKELRILELFKHGKIVERFKSAEDKCEECNNATNDKVDVLKVSSQHMGVQILDVVTKLEEQTDFKLNKSKSEYDRKTNKMKQDLGIIQDLIQKEFRNEMDLFEAKIELKIETMSKMMKEQEKNKLEEVQQLNVKVSEVDKDIQKIKLIDPNQVKLKRMIDKITKRMEQIEKKIPFPEFTLA